MDINTGPAPGMRFAVCVLLMQSAGAYYLPVTVVGPRLATASGVPLHWSTGQVAALIDTSHATRVSARGILFYDHSVHPLSAGFECERVHGALCRLRDGNLLFPVAPRYTPEGRKPPPMDRIVGCGATSEGRLVVGREGVYDLSACDLVAGGADVLWADGVAYVDTRLALPDWAYAYTALSVLVLVVSLGQNIAQMLGDAAASTSPWATEGACLAQVALILLLQDPRRVWVSSNDRFMAALTVLYVVAYLCRHAFALVVAGQAYTLNIITGTLMLVTARLYCSFETPYATIFLILLMTRLAHKLHSEPAGIDRLIACLDAAYVAVHYRVGYRASFWDPQVVSLASPLSCFIIH